MKTWEKDSIRRQFASAAERAENYARELAGRIKRDPNGSSDSVKDLHDEHLAKWYVYDSFSYSSCLESRDEFLEEVKMRLETTFDYKMFGCFNLENSQKHWRFCMNRLIREFENP